jgi:hypothetical protein
VRNRIKAFSSTVCCLSSLHLLLNQKRRANHPCLCSPLSKNVATSLYVPFRFTLKLHVCSKHIAIHMMCAPPGSPRNSSRLTHKYLPSLCRLSLFTTLLSLLGSKTYTPRHHVSSPRVPKGHSTLPHVRSSSVSSKI